MKLWAIHRQGFTIVELLIVIVVIAILAAITIVAYTGIQNRAKASAVSSAASQAGKQALAYAPTNNDLYPTEAQFQTSSFRTTTLKLPTDTPEATYDYYASDDQKSFCLSVTDTTTSPETAYAMTQNGATVPGRCVENLVRNPSFEIDLAGWSTTSNASQSRASGGKEGSWRLNVSRTGTGDPYAMLGVSSVNMSAPYTVTVWVLGTGAQTSTGSQLQEMGGAYRTMSQLVPPGVIPAASWTIYGGSFTTPADLSGSFRYILRPGLNIGEVLGYDALMLVSGLTRYNYGDGTTANWSWTGTPHNSTSFGPALPQ